MNKDFKRNLETGYSEENNNNSARTNHSIFEEYFVYEQEEKNRLVHRGNVHWKDGNP